MNYVIEHVTEREQLDEFYNHSTFTLEGLSEDSIPDLMNWLEEKTEFTSDNPIVYVTKGKLMNEVYELTGDNAYQDDASIVSVMDIDMMKVVLARFEIGARWFDDIVENNRFRELAKYSDDEEYEE